MKTRINAKYFISAATAAVAVASIGCIAMADEVQTEDGSSDETVAVIYEVEETVADEASYAKDGWSKEDGYWYYYIDGEKAVSWQEIGGKWYYFSQSGRMQTGSIHDYKNDVYYITGTDGAMLADQWILYSGSWHYAGKNGKLYTDWKKMDGKWYYFNSVGVLMTGFNNFKGTYYYFGNDGAMRTGWVKYNDRWYYFDPVSGTAVKGFQELDGKWYYFAEDDFYGPYMKTNNRVYLDGKIYGFDENGVMRTGWFRYNEGWFYFDHATGAAIRGWHKIGGIWYYFYEDPSSLPYTPHGLTEVDGKNYYFDPDTGEMVTGKWISLYIGFAERWIYADKSGEVVTGWNRIGGKWYYFGSAKSPYMYTGFQTFDGSSYYFTDKGVLSYGWVKYNNRYYYAGNDGSLLKETWKFIEGKWYYFDSAGVMKTGLCKIDGIYYDFGPDGACRNPYSDIK